MEPVSIDPSWPCIVSSRCRYAFPLPHDGGVIDLTADEKPFYFNPYSGELTLDFPKAERKGRGGILAFVVLLMCPLTCLNLVLVTVKSLLYSVLYPEADSLHL